jgi:hypothetical protein
VFRTIVLVVPWVFGGLSICVVCLRSNIEVAGCTVGMQCLFGVYHDLKDSTGPSHVYIHFGCSHTIDYALDIICLVDVMFVASGI